MPVAFKSKYLLKYYLVVLSCSELLYPEGSISPSSGVVADILCKGRDYLVSSVFFNLWISEAK